MATVETPVHLCQICGEEILLEYSKTDEQGNAVHEDCYLQRLMELIQRNSIKPATH